MKLMMQWLADEGGQDILEYVLLGSVLGFAGLVALQNLEDIMNAVYASWDATTQYIWEPDPPL